MRRYGIGLIGLGFGRGALALNHVPDSRLEVRGVASKTPEHLAMATGKFGVPFATEDYRELLVRPGVDIVGVFTPDHLHAEHAAAALMAGKHVVCTKPMVTTLEDCDRLVRLVQRTGCKFVVAQTWRNLPRIRAARRVFDSGQLGDIMMIDTGYVHDMREVCKRTPWRVAAPQDFLFGGGAHAIDCVRWFAGDIEEVSAYALKSGAIPGYPLEDTWILNLKFQSGALGRVSVMCSAIHPTHGTHQRLQIFGTKGTITGMDLGQDGVPKQTTLEIETPGSTASPIEGHASELLPYFERMIDWIEAGTDPDPSVIEGARGIAVAVAARQSLVGGVPVKVRNDF